MDGDFRIAGGSSGGSAAAVAAGIVYGSVNNMITKVSQHDN